MLTETAGLQRPVAAQRPRMERIAKSWLASGCRAFGLYSGGEADLLWPEGMRPDGPHLHAELRAGAREYGELRVWGPPRPGWQERLDADAALVGRILALEEDLEQMTAEVINTQDQLVALYDLTESMRSYIRVDDTLRALVRHAVRLTGSSAGFGLLESPDGRCAAREPAGDIDPDSLEPALQAVRDRGAEVVSTSDEMSRTLWGEPGSLILLPVRARGEIVGVLGLTRGSRGFVSPDLKLARTIAEQGGARVEAAFLYKETLERQRLETELELAATIQQRLLPHDSPVVPGVDVYGKWNAASHVAGDLFDFILLPGKPFTFAVADVTGKGMAAAILMSIAHTAVRSAVRRLPAPTPASVLERVANGLYDDFSDTRMFATMFLAMYDPGARAVTYVNAGHSPVVYCPAGEPARFLHAECEPLGIFPTITCPEQTVRLDPGDVLVVATDGFSEARNRDGELFGYDRLLRLVEERASSSAREIADALFDAVREFGAGMSQDDDQTLIVARGVEA